MSAREMSDATRQQIRSAISNAYYDARNDGRTMEAAADAAVEALTPIIALIDDNAHGRGARDVAAAFGREADASSTGIWREAVDLVERLAIAEIQAVTA